MTITGGIGGKRRRLYVDGLAGLVLVARWTTTARLSPGEDGAKIKRTLHGDIDAIPIDLRPEFGGRPLARLDADSRAIGIGLCIGNRHDFVGVGIRLVNPRARIVTGEKVVFFQPFTYS